MRRTIVSALFVALACNASAARAQLEISDPRGVSATDNSLAFVIDNGCLPYALDGVSEQRAAQAIGLVRQATALKGLFPTPPDHSYGGRFRGLGVDLYRGRCIVHINGKAYDTYQQVIEAALRRRIGPRFDQRAVLPAPLPSYQTFCLDGVGYEYGSTPRGQFGYPQYDLSISRRACRG